MMYRTLFALFFLAFATGCASQQEHDLDKSRTTTPARNVSSAPQQEHDLDKWRRLGRNADLRCASPQESDLDKLQGSWLAVAVEQSDLDFSPYKEKILLARKLHFFGNRCIIDDYWDDPRTVTYSLNTEKSPREIVVEAGSYDERTYVGIYKLEGDRRFTFVCSGLTRGFSDFPPTEFKTFMGDGGRPSFMCITFEKISDTVTFSPGSSLRKPLHHL